MHRFPLRDVLGAVHSSAGADMEQILMNLIAGAIGGNAAGKATPSFDLGTLGNTISGLVGGGVLGQLIPWCCRLSARPRKAETSASAAFSPPDRRRRRRRGPDRDHRRREEQGGLRAPAHQRPRSGTLRGAGLRGQALRNRRDGCEAAAFPLLLPGVPSCHAQSNITSRCIRPGPIWATSSSTRSRAGMARASSTAQSRCARLRRDRRIAAAERHPVRQRYRLVDLQRWRERRGLPLVLEPKHFPFDPSLADRVAVAILAAGADPAGFIADVMAGVWAREEDMREPEAISGLRRACGLRWRSPAGAGRERDRAANTMRRRSRRPWGAGVFGAPSYVLDGEVFWGQDRLELLDAALASGRAPYRPDPVA
ncbi:DSBA-like thioredoxin domain-containing protein [Ditylenchus destructor]|uniref:DSBA-like thioredoxin domain-containing protein n=1 Tax=Ditylenchus destructor TaxID=166010 RepID=A0AAD4QUR2_9BILA|nr:DSBA-like thioredoxin domain-containing protein [Ditylenchus destructor]